MEKSINYYTNDIIDELIVNSKCNQNSLSIKVSLEYAMKLVKINWGDIMFAIKNNYFNIESAIEYAMCLMEKEECDYLTIDLACTKESELTKEELLENYINKFVMKITDEERIKSKDKILYILMNWLYDNRQLFENPFRVIEVLYDDFGFPEALKKVVSYVPSYKEFDEEENLFYTHWREYLLLYKERFSY